MSRDLTLAVTGVILAIAITTSMDATGYSVFSALPLLPLTGLFWYIQKLSRAEIGLTWGTGRTYLLALAYPLLVLGLIAAIAFILGAVDLGAADWRKAFLNMGLMSTTGVLVILATEEGFFRGGCGEL